MSAARRIAVAVAVDATHVAGNEKVSRRGAVVIDDQNPEGPPTKVRGPGAG